MAPDLADEMSTGWSIEPIPDEHYLFLRVHKSDIDPDNGEPIPRAFRNQPKGSLGMSTDWERYAIAADTQRRGRKSPEEYAVVKFVAGNARAIPGQSVVHEPTYPINQAHTEVFGEKGTTEVREKFMQIYEPEIRLATPA